MQLRLYLAVAPASILRIKMVCAVNASLRAGVVVSCTNCVAESVSGASALHEAAFAGQTGALEILINSGSNLVLRDNDGNSVCSCTVSLFLTCALYQPNVACVGHALRSGARQCEVHPFTAGEDPCRDSSKMVPFHL